MQFHGVPKIVAAAFPLLLGIPLARELFLRRRPLVVTPVMILLVLFFCVQAIGVAFSREIARSGDALLTLLFEGLILYLLITNVIRTTAVLRGATWALLGAGVLMSIVPLYQQVTRRFDDSSIDAIHESSRVRSVSTDPSNRYALLSPACATVRRP